MGGHEVASITIYYFDNKYIKTVFDFISFLFTYVVGVLVPLIYFVPVSLPPIYLVLVQLECSWSL